MAALLQFSDRHFPLGSTAMHPKYGFVEIVSVDGLKREIVYDHFEKEILGEDEPDDVLCGTLIETRDAWVEVKDLRPASLEDEKKWLILRGDLVGKPEDYYVFHHFAN